MLALKILIYSSKLQFLGLRKPAAFGEPWLHSL